MSVISICQQQKLKSNVTT